MITRCVHIDGNTYRMLEYLLEHDPILKRENENVALDLLITGAVEMRYQQIAALRKLQKRLAAKR